MGLSSSLYVLTYFCFDLCYAKSGPLKPFFHGQDINHIFTDTFYYGKSKKKFWVIFRRIRISLKKQPFEIFQVALESRLNLSSSCINQNKSMSVHTVSCSNSAHVRDVSDNGENLLIQKWWQLLVLSQA